jgi:hypothetical protein
MLDTRQTNRRFWTEWYTCDKCGFDYPRERVIVQNGLISCTGTGTNHCVDEPGRDAYMNHLEAGYEELPQPLPEINEDL